MANVVAVGRVPSSFVGLRVQYETPGLAINLARASDFCSGVQRDQGLGRADRFQLDACIVENVGDGLHFLFGGQALLLDVAQGLWPRFETLLEVVKGEQSYLLFGAQDQLRLRLLLHIAGQLLGQRFGHDVGDLEFLFQWSAAGKESAQALKGSHSHAGAGGQERHPDLSYVCLLTNHVGCDATHHAWMLHRFVHLAFRGGVTDHTEAAMRLGREALPREKDSTALPRVRFGVLRHHGMRLLQVAEDEVGSFPVLRAGTRVLHSRESHVSLCSSMGPGLPIQHQPAMSPARQQRSLHPST